MFGPTRQPPNQIRLPFEHYLQIKKNRTQTTYAFKSSIGRRDILLQHIEEFGDILDKLNCYFVIKCVSSRNDTLLERQSCLRYFKDFCENEC